MPEGLPVEKGQVLRVNTFPNEKGPDPIAWVDGLAVFVEGARPFDDVVIRVTYCGESWAKARVLTDAEAEAVQRV